MKRSKFTESGIIGPLKHEWMRVVVIRKRTVVVDRAVR